MHVYFVIVTELGVVVSENNSVVKAFTFGNPAADFMDIKKAISKITQLWIIFKD